MNASVFVVSGERIYEGGAADADRRTDSGCKWFHWHRHRQDRLLPNWVSAHLGPLLLICFNLNPSMERSLKMWDEMIYPISKLQRYNRWSFGMDNYSHPILYYACVYLSMLRLKLIHVSKGAYSGLLCNSFEDLMSSSNFIYCSPMKTSWHAFRITGPLWGNPPVTGGFPDKGPIMRSLIYPLFPAWISCWTNHRVAGDLRRHDAHITLLPCHAISKWVFSDLIK